MATIYELHPENPQERSIEQITKALKDGAIMLYPTDTVYAIGCDLNSKSGIDRVRQIKQLSNDKPLTFLCSSLSNISEYAIVSNEAYRLIKRLIPGPYTFLLPATKSVPRLVMSPKRKTTGIRVPNHKVCLSLLEALGNPIISTSAHISNDDEGQVPTVLKTDMGLDKVHLFDYLEKIVDVIVDVDDGSGLRNQVSTIIDMTLDKPTIVRSGLGADLIVNLIGENFS